MKAEAAPHLGMILLVWLIMLGLITLACAPVIYALAAIWSASPW
ncbi:hypothetical protein [Bosea sp. ANAM02]|nr:hypothetical protein [Bosea sp. ANAM02]BCB18028.1 hypothetical protein OCUBac02_09220 [Bosea sp. ANAM02]